MARPVFQLPPPPTAKNSTKSARQRLHYDFREVVRNPLPLISAHPVEENVFCWHCNLAGPEGTQFHKTVFHIVLMFPMDYPQGPPQVLLCTSLPHPNVFGNQLCLDMLQPSTDPFTGWSSAYTVQSILVQLQSFLFVRQEDAEPNAVVKAIKDARDFKCPGCEHRNYRHWPPLPSTIDNAEWLVVKSQTAYLREELRCFFTKVSFTEKPLGFGLSVRRNTRTQQIQTIKSNFDLLSIYAFNNLHVRKSAANLSFAYWMPVFINPEHGVKAYPLAKKAISMIYEGNTTQFQPFMVLDILPKIMTTLVVELAQEGLASIKELQGFMAVHRLLLRFVEEFPELRDMATKKIQAFIADEKNRHKDVVPALGEFICLLMISHIGWDELKGAYLEESFQRGVLWIINDYPELAKLEADPQVDVDRVDKSFSVGHVGHRLLLFWIYIAEGIASPKRDFAQVCQSYDENYGFPTEQQVQDLQARFKWLDANIHSFDIYFKELRVQPPADLCAVLRESIKKSQARGYHGARGTAITKNVFINSRFEKIESTLIQLQNQKDDLHWRRAFVDLFEKIEHLAKRPSWRNAFQQEALSYYLTNILHSRADWPHFKKYLSLCPDITTCTFHHQYPGTSNIKKKDTILSVLIDGLPGLKDLTVVAGSYTYSQKSRVKNLLKALVYGLRRDCLTHLTLRGFVGHDLDSVFAILPNQTNLYSLSFDQIVAEGHQIANTVNFLKTAKSLQEVKMDSSSQYCLPLFTALQQGNRITNLTLTGYSSSSWKKIVHVLPSSLVSLDTQAATFHRGEGVPSGVDEFIAFLDRSPQLTTLNMNFGNVFRGLGYGEYHALYQQLAERPIKSLTIHGRHFPVTHTWKEEAYKHVTTILFHNNSTITHLKLVGSDLFPTEILYAGVDNITIPLEHLEMDSSTTGADKNLGAVLLAVPLKKLAIESSNKRFIESFLGSTKLLEALKYTTPSTVADRGFTKEAIEIFDALSVSQPNLEILDFQRRKMAPNGVVALARYLGLPSCFKNMKTLNLYGTDLGPRGAKLVCNALKDHPSLTKFDIGFNSIKDKGATELAAFLQTSQLRCLRAKSNFFSEQGLLVIAAAVLNQTSKTLDELYLGDNPGLCYASVLKLLVRLKHLQTEDIKPEDTMEIESLSITEEVLPSTHILDTLYLDVLPIFITHSVDHLDRTLCVNGLPLGTTEKSIAAFFQERGCGVVTNTDLKSNKRFRTNYAFVELDSPESVTRAMDLGAAGKAQLGGCHLGVYKAGTSQNAKRRKVDKKKPAKAVAGGAGRGGRATAAPAARGAGRGNRY